MQRVPIPPSIPSHDRDEHAGDESSIPDDGLLVFDDAEASADDPPVTTVIA